VSSSQRLAPRAILTDPFHFLAFGFGSGFIPYAPGTAGTLAAIPIFVVVQALPIPIYIAVAAIMLLVGIWICGRASVALGVHDHSGIVWDEIVGFLVAMMASPAGWRWIILGALLFRILDITKPWPVSLVDRRLGGGVGIMLDDMIAGIYSLLIIQAVARLV
jgi:phosphatidylglycerophosphatase A